MSLWAGVHAGPRPCKRVGLPSPLSTGGLLVEWVARDGGEDGLYGESQPCPTVLCANA